MIYDWFISFAKNGRLDLSNLVVLHLNSLTFLFDLVREFRSHSLKRDLSLFTFFSANFLHNVSRLSFKVLVPKNCIASG